MNSKHLNEASLFFRITLIQETEKNNFLKLFFCKSKLDKYLPFDVNTLKTNDVFTYKPFKFVRN